MSEVDEERKRFLVTLNPKEVTMADSKGLSNAVKGEHILYSLLKEKEEILNEMNQLPGIERIIFLISSRVFSTARHLLSLSTYVSLALCDIFRLLNLAQK